MRERLNLASRPFRNETLPAIAFAVAGAVLLGLTAEHAVLIRRLLPARTSALHQEVATLEAEAARLRAEGAGLRAPKPQPSSVAEWEALEDLVDRRAFRWTELFSRLEDVLPDGVRLVSIRPEVKKGQVHLDVNAVVRSAEDGLEFVQILQGRSEFAEVYPLRVGKGAEGGEFHYTMRYRPAAAAPEGEKETP